MTISEDRQLNWLSFYDSSLGKKIITGITGLGLTLFVLFHMMGNLVLLSDRTAYNQLAHWLNSFGFLLYGVELILLIAVIFHLIVGITIRVQARRSRSVAYEQLKSAGAPSKQSLSSRSMAITGLIVLTFLVLHLQTFKFGTYYSTTVNGIVMRDLARLVSEKFQQGIYTFSYVGFITFLGVHLRHGIWSAGQSLGLLKGRTSSFVYGMSLLCAVLISLGFIVIPGAIYFDLIN